MEPTERHMKMGDPARSIAHAPQPSFFPKEPQMPPKKQNCRPQPQHLVPQEQLLPSSLILG